MTPLAHNPALVPPVGAPAPVAPATAPRTGGATAPNGPSFADVLGDKAGAVQLSSHAKARIERRAESALGRSRRQATAADEDPSPIDPDHRTTTAPTIALGALVDVLA